jgi:beta-phosphoglucomutase-like phosphatase (HAD superfamily)
LLEVSARLRKPPVLTVVLTDATRDIPYAKQAGMKVICVPGSHYAYELKSADILLPSLADVRIVFVKRLVDIGDLQKYEEVRHRHGNSSSCNIKPMFSE